MRAAVDNHRLWNGTRRGGGWFVTLAGPVGFLFRRQPLGPRL